ncbi:MAG TPA: Ig-like domain-containing protein, partial [Gemmatimonadales bacterium]|nr:Ig-like domain-containing protein [Gemmatimonadales bacterium]
VAAVAGVANFPSLILTKAGTYTLQASAVFSGTTVLSPASTPTAVIPAPGKQLTFTAGPPASAQAGTAITPLAVSALDSLGNVATGFTGQISLSITSGTGKTGAHLLGTTAVSASAGVATFTTVNVDSTGIGYTLTAGAAGLTSGTSSAFTITPGPATHLVFAVPPSNTVANSPINPAVQVAAHDAFENTATSFTGSVTIAIGTNPLPGGVLSSGTPNPANAVSGIATFPSLSIDRVNNGYTLTASASGLTGATSGLFNIVNSNVSPTNSSVTATSPITVCQTGCSTGAGTASLITVTVRDQGNAPVAGAQVLLSAPGASFTQPGLTNASGVTTGTMTSTVAPQVVSVTAVANGVTISTQPPVTVNPGQPVSLTFTSQPSNTVAGATINGGSGIQVTAKDQFGNTATAFTGAVAMAIATGPGTTLTGTTGVNAVAGIATFSTLSILTPVGAYTLRASTTAPALSTTSCPFSISAGAVARDTFIVQPQQTAVLARIDSGNASGGVVVWITDAFGNLVTTATNNVTVALFDNPAGATLGGTKTRAASGGILTFNDLTISKIGTGFTLIANISGFSSDVSAPFDVIPGPAKTLVFKTQPPGSLVAGTLFGATIAALDVAGDTATGFTGNVTMAIGANPASGTLSGTNPVAAVAGIATFSNLSIDKAGSPYTLVASTPPLPSGSVTSSTSNNFTVQPGGVSATQSGVSALPAIDTACAASCSPAALTASTITVTAKDGAGNLITSGLPVTVTITGAGNTPTSPVNGTTDGTGHFTFTLTSTVAQVKNISAVINGVTIT